MDVSQMKLGILFKFTLEVNTYVSTQYRPQDNLRLDLGFSMHNTIMVFLHPDIGDKICKIFLYYYHSMPSCIVILVAPVSKGWLYSPETYLKIQRLLCHFPFGGLRLQNSWPIQLSIILGILKPLPTLDYIPCYLPLLSCG